MNYRIARNGKDWHVLTPEERDRQVKERRKKRKELALPSLKKGDLLKCATKSDCLWINVVHSHPQYLHPIYNGDIVLTLGMCEDMVGFRFLHGEQVVDIAWSILLEEFVRA